MNRFARIPVVLAARSARHPWTAVAGATLVAGLSVLALMRTTATPSIQAMVGDDSPAAAAMARLSAEYPGLDELMVVATVRDATLSSAAARSILRDYAESFRSELAADPEAAAMVVSVRYAPDPSEREFVDDAVLPAGAFYLSDAGFEALLQRLRPEEMRRQIARSEALAAAPGPAASAIGKAVLRDPLRLAELVPGGSVLAPNGAGRATPLDLSTDGRSLLFRVEGVTPSDDLEFARRFSRRVAQIAGQAAGPGIRAELAGSYAIATTTAGAIREDAIRSTVAAIVLLHAIFFVFYRRLVAPLIVAVVAGVGILAGFGVHAAFVPTITPLTAVIGAVLAGLGVDYGIHFLSNFQAERVAGKPPVEAVTAAMQHVGAATAANCATSIVGFLAVVPSGIAILRDFAVLGLLGLVGALLSVFTLMPALLVLTTRGAPPCDTYRVAAALVAGPTRRPRLNLALAACVLLGAVIAGGSEGWYPRLETSLSVMHPRPNNPLELTESLNSRFASRGETVPVEVRAGSLKELVTRAHDAARALTSPEARAAGVTASLGLHSLLPDSRLVAERASRLVGLDPGRVVSDFDAAIESSVFSPAAFAEYRGFLRRLVSARAAPTPADLRQYPQLARRVLPEPGRPPSTVLAVFVDRPMSDRATRDAAVSAIRKALVGVPDATPTGLAVVGYDLEQATRVALPRSLGLAVLLVGASLLVYFRCVSDVLLALVPLVFGAAATYAFLLVARVPLNAINGAGLPLLVGIAVDAGVYMVSRSRVAGQTRLAPTMHAVLAASTTTVAGFGALWFTRTPAIQSLGLVTSVGVTAALVGVVIVLVPLLALRSRP